MMPEEGKKHDIGNQRGRMMPEKRKKARYR